MENFTVIKFVFILILIQHIEGSTLRIVGGYDASEKYGRFHASLQNLTGHHVCGGAVISTQHVITAAHCLFGAEPQYIKVVVGTTNLDKHGQQYDVAAINIHRNYNYSLRTNDIAILKVNKPFNLKFVDILELYEKKLTEGDPLTLTGFGALKSNGASSRIMHVLNLTVFNQDTCKYAMRYSREVFDSMFCTFTKIGQGTCHGDSGGPLTKDGKLAGLVSWGIPCGVGFPDVHTRISSYIDWIHSQIANPLLDYPTM